MARLSSNLVSAEWLEAHLDGRNIIVLFITMADIATGQPETLPAGFIPGSVVVDFEKVLCDKKSPFVHTMPNEATFQREVRKLGIDKNSHIIVYDSKGLFCAPRVWWMFKAMGHDNIQILDGGLPGWIKQGYAVNEKSLAPFHVGNFEALAKPRFFVSTRAILKHLKAITVLDARSEGRFKGSAPEPRAGLRSGHIPSSINLPFTLCLKDGHLKNVTELHDLFAQRGINEDSYIVTSCGSGVTACILALAASELGYYKLSVYDGSWSEWGADAKLPVALG